MNILAQPPKEQAMISNEADRQADYVAPSADVESTDIGYVIGAEMPGVEKDGLEITADRGELGEDYRKYRPRDLDRCVTNSRNRQTSQDRCAISGRRKRPRP